MGTATEPRSPGKAWGIAILLGYFMLFMATVMLLAAGWRAYRAYLVQTRWIEIQARIKTCAVDVDHPFARDGGGTRYSLACRLQYDAGFGAYESDLRTISDPTLDMRDRIAEWIGQNPPGTALKVRVNPSSPAELVVRDPLPIQQFLTARDAWMTTLIAGIPGLLLIAIGRKLRR